MKTVQMTLDEQLLARVDRMARRLGTSRSAFTRDALKAALLRLREEDLERKQREGYTKRPVEPDEFEAWIDEQVWPN